MKYFVKNHYKWFSTCKKCFINISTKIYFFLKHRKTNSQNSFVIFLRSVWDPKSSMSSSILLGLHTVCYASFFMHSKHPSIDH